MLCSLTIGLIVAASGSSLLLWDESAASQTPAIPPTRPVVILEVRGVTAKQIGDYLTEVTVSSGSGDGWAREMERFMFRPPFGLSPEPPRARGLALFWNAAGRIPPLPAEFWELEAEEACDPGIAPQTTDERAGKFVVTEPYPGRWQHSYHPFDMVTENRDGKQAFVRRPGTRSLYSHYFAVHEGLLWQSSFPFLLSADLPQLKADGGAGPRVRLTTDFAVLDSSVRAAWLSAGISGSAVKKQRQNQEPVWAWLLRSARVDAAEWAMRSLLSDDGRVTGEASVAESGDLEVRMAVRLPQKDQWPGDSANGWNELTAIEAEQPWLNLWLNCRGNESLQTALTGMAAELSRADDGESRQWASLARQVADSKDRQVALAAIAEPSGRWGVVVGVRLADPEVTREFLIKFLEPVLQRLTGSRQSIPSAWRSANGCAWLVFGTSDPQAVAERLSKYEPERGGSLHDRSVATLHLYLQRLLETPRVEHAADQRSEDPAPVTAAAAWNRVLSVMGAIRRNEETVAGSSWELRLAVQETESGLQLDARCGSLAAKCLTAALLSQIEAMKAASRLRNR
jgi:hypothetical protein